MTTDERTLALAELSIEWRTLLAAAESARDRAHAPYSQFAVGAAVRTASGRIFEGCNIENASYGLTVCAERVAIWNAAAHGDSHIVELALVTKGGGTPCGACRQVMAEFAHQDLTILVADTDGKGWFTTLGELLPCSFTGQDLISSL